MASDTNEATPLIARPIETDRNDAEEGQPNGLSRLHTSMTDLHLKANEHAYLSSTVPQLHDEGKAPSAEDAKAAYMVFLVTVGPILCCMAAVFGVVGYLAIHYSGTTDDTKDSSECPFPLAKCLFYYGCVLCCMGVVFLLSLVFPPIYACMTCFQCALQVVMICMLVMTLMAYGQARQCGETLWWAALIFSSPPIACCVYLCCSPFGHAKAAIFLSYKALTASAIVKPPSYKATATVLKSASPV